MKYEKLRRACFKCECIIHNSNTFMQQGNHRSNTEQYGSWQWDMYIEKSGMTRKIPWDRGCQMKVICHDGSANLDKFTATRMNMETGTWEGKNICKDIEVLEMETTSTILKTIPSALNDETGKDTEIRCTINREQLMEDTHDHGTKGTIVGKEINIAKIFRQNDHTITGQSQREVVILDTEGTEITKSTKSFGARKG